jgi:hypothetical protein
MFRGIIGRVFDSWKWRRLLARVSRWMGGGPGRLAASVLCSGIAAVGEHHQVDSRHLECRVACSSDGMPNTWT